jgi:hypothetical protein
VVLVGAGVTVVGDAVTVVIVVVVVVGHVSVGSHVERSH